MSRDHQSASDSTTPRSPGSQESARCRFCDSHLKDLFVDLGMSPLSNGHLNATDLNRMEPFYPLRVYVCRKCLLVQLEEFQSPDHIFSDYIYFSSFSETWLQHCKSYSEMIVARLALNYTHQVVEIASNDGYLLQNFAEKGIPVLGIEPAANVAEVAIAKGVTTLVEFFGASVARRLIADGIGADLVVGNNVLAHVPSLNDFVIGLKILLKPQGVITMEFPHLMRLMDENQFDTIYHEHFSYFSLIAVEKIFAAHALTLFDVDELDTHGGSLRIYVRHAEDGSKPINQRIVDLRNREKESGFASLQTYLCFADKVKAVKHGLLEFLIKVKREGKVVVGYGAPAKGNTLLNYCGIRSDFIDYTVDRSPHKQGRFLPGTHIPIYSPDRISETMPDYLLILPWNLKEEIMDQMKHIRQWNGRFVVPIPEVKVF